MAEQSNPKPQSSKKEPNSSSGKSPSWLLYILLALLLGQAVFYFNGDQAEEISWTRFKQEMLGKGDVYKIEVINQKKAEVYIKPEALASNRYPEIDSSQAGPQYTFNIGSLDNFQETLDFRDQLMEKTHGKVIVRLVQAVHCRGTQPGLAE